MKYKQNNMLMNFKGQSLSLRISTGFLILLFQVSSAWAEELILETLNFSVLPGNELQLQLGMNGPVNVTPKIFQTDNPARIALDFPGMKSALKKKLHPVNIGVVSSVYAVQASDRLRVVVNLLDTVPYETRVEGNNFYLKLKATNKTDVSRENIHPDVKSTVVSSLIPEQSIKNLDFRRGPNGEGRIQIGLSNPNTVVDSTEKGGKIVLNFLNTQLPADLAKRVDVSDFATPVLTIDTMPVGSRVRMIVTPRDGNFEYSSYQADGLLTIEFRPLTSAEKEKLERKRFPYSGERLSLNFQDIEVRSVLQILADFTDLNIIAADSVSGEVTLRLNDVPWDQALDLIIKSKGLAKRETGNVILVAPMAEINKIEKEELEAKQIIRQLEPLRTEYIQINYAKANNFRNILLGISTGSIDGCTMTSSATGGTTRGGSVGTANLGGGLGQQRSSGGVRGREDDKYSLLSERGTAIVDARTNTLIVRDTVKHLEEIRSMINLLDIPVRQVMIESRIVIALSNFSEELGVRFGIKNVNNPNLAFATGQQSAGGVLVDGLVDLAAANPYGQVSATLLRMGDYLLNLEITAKQDIGEAELLSNPRLLTTDRCEAVIKQGTEIPYQTSSGNLGTNIQFKDAVLELKVTPQITPSGSVLMDLYITKNSKGDTAPNGEIIIDTREIGTSVLVENGDTVVLGGIFEGDKSYNEKKVPWFADLPGLGWLFTNSLEIDRKAEMLIFVTPKVVKESLAAR
jgi:type IV pilus assembly protein PilQ